MSRPSARSARAALGRGPVAPPSAWPWHALRWHLWLIAGVLVAWAAVDPRFRTAEGDLGPRVCFPVALGLAAIVSGFGITGGARRFCLWLALAVVGQAASLQLIEAGRFIRYQHYPPLDRLVTGAHPALLALIAVQALIVVGGLREPWRQGRAWLRRHLGGWQLVGVAAAIVLSSASVSWDLRRYLAELVLASFVQAVNLGNLIALAWSIPPGTLAAWRERLGAAFASPGASARATRWPDPVPVLAAIWVGSVAAVLCVLSYERHPHIPDEVAYLYHARFLAAGALTLPAPPVPDAFDLYLMQVDGDRWYSAMPPGWPAILALGVLLGVPWLVNPILAAINVGLSYRVAAALYDRGTARLAALLLACSPWHVFMAMNFMNHTATFTCALAAAVGVIGARASRGRRAIAWALGGGGALGVGFLIRPLDGLIVTALVVLWALGVGGRRLAPPALAALVLGVAVTGALVLAYNQQLTGHATAFPITTYMDQRYGKNSYAYGFGPDRGHGWPIDPFPGHGLTDALVNANLNTFSVNIELFGWSTGSLVLPVLLILGGGLRKRDALLVTVVGVVFVAYFFNYFSGGPDFGARYWYLMLFPCVALSARAVQWLEREIARGAATIAFLALSALAVVNYFPWRAIDKYHHYLDMRPDVRRLTDEGRFGNGLVLIRGRGHPDYASAAIYNPLDLQTGGPVFAWDRRRDVTARVLEAYPDRPIWVVHGPSLTRRGFEVVRGPASRDEFSALRDTEATLAPR